MSAELVPSSRTRNPGALEWIAGTLVAVPGFIAVLSGASLLGFGMTLGGIGLFGVGRMLLLSGQVRRFVTENATTQQQLANGELAAARAFYWKWSETTRIPVVAALARHNLAWTMMRQGELASAIAVWVDNEKQFAKYMPQAQLSPTSAVDLALAYALTNEVDAAERWMTVAGQRAEHPRTPAHPAMAAFARGAIELRAGRAEAAAKGLDDAWSDAEANLTGSTLRPLRVLRAFAITQTGTRQAGVAERLIEGMKPQYPEELAFLAASWPELGAFLDAHGLR